MSCLTDEVKEALGGETCKASDGGGTCICKQDNCNEKGTCPCLEKEEEAEGGEGHLRGGGGSGSDRGAQPQKGTSLAIVMWACLSVIKRLSLV